MNQPAWAQDGESKELKSAQSHTEGLADKVASSVVSVIIRQGFGAFGGARSATGFFISQKGHIVTSAAAIGDRDEYTIICRRSIRARATVLGRDPISNFALLQVKDLGALKKRFGGRLATLKLGSSSKVRTGQFVFTIGDGFSSLASDGKPTLSLGVVTRIGRMAEVSGKYRGVVLETDAAVNEGSFGSPLIDLKGRVVGVVAGAYSRRRWLGTAMPIDNFKKIKGLLVKGQKPVNGSLGVVVEDTRGEASSDGLKILETIADGAAEKCGLRAGDKIVSIDSVQIFDADDMGRELAALPAGTRVYLKVRRGQRELDLIATLEAQEAESSPAATTTEGARPYRVPYLGLSVGQGDESGLTIKKVKKNSPFKKLGVKAGDKIVKYNNKPVTDRKSLRQAVSSAAVGSKIVVVISRGGWEKELNMTVAGKAVRGVRKNLGLRVRDGRSGVEIVSVANNSQADKLGIKKGDVVVMISAKGVRGFTMVKTVADYNRALKSFAVGATLRVVVRRDGWDKDFELVLRGSKKAKKPAGPSLGAQLSESEQGLLIEDLRAGGCFAKAGLKKGDVIVVMGDRRAPDFKFVTAFLRRAKVGQKVNLVVSRGGWEKDLTVTLTAGK